MSKIPFRPLYDQVVIRRDKPPAKIGSIFLPDTVQERLQKEATSGVVVAIGPGRWKREKRPHDIDLGFLMQTAPYGLCKRCGDPGARSGEECPKLVDTGERWPVDVAVGDRVLFHPDVGTGVAIDGDEYRVAWDDECMAVEERHQAAAE